MAAILERVYRVPIFIMHVLSVYFASWRLFLCPALCGIRKSIAVLESFRTSPACPSDKISIEMKVSMEQ
jgi:hypothetical protein